MILIITIISINLYNWQVFVMKTQSVFCEQGTEFWNVKSEVLTAVNMKITVFLDLTQCNLVKKMVKMEAAGSFEMSVPTRLLGVTSQKTVKSNLLNF
jgi:hypothetical protein